ncbi:leucine-rich repeat domain-containing protein [bacterium]|nr:leucine-rich repeat domain-containing protein [bacterium]
MKNLRSIIVLIFALGSFTAAQAILEEKPFKKDFSIYDDIPDTLDDWRFGCFTFFRDEIRHCCCCRCEEMDPGFTQMKLLDFFEKVKRGSMPEANKQEKAFFKKAKTRKFLTCDLTCEWKNHIHNTGALPPEIGLLKNLESIKLIHCKITSIPDEIGNLSKLKTLELKDNCIKVLPRTIGNLSELETLTVDKNHLTQLPREIAKLKKLRELGLSCNKLTALPPEFIQLQNLRGLTINGMFQFPAIPDQIGHLKKLERLFFTMGSIPTNVQKWCLGPKSKKRFLLECKNNGGIRHFTPPVPLPDESGTLRLKNTHDVEWLSEALAMNQKIAKHIFSKTKSIKLEENLSDIPLPIPEYRTCPSDTCDQTKMYHLECTSAEQVAALQASLDFDPALREAIKKTQVLTLHNLGLTSVPQFIFSLENLERLFLENNQISYLHEEIGQLKKLTFMGLGNNRLHSLPLSLQKLKSLKALLLDRNPLDDYSAPAPHLARLPNLQALGIDQEPADHFYTCCSNKQEKKRFIDLFMQNKVEPILTKSRCFPWPRRNRVCPE